MSRLRLLIADDHAILRFGLRRLLGEMAEVEAIGEAENGARVAQLLREEHWDVLVLDLDMPGQNVLDVLKRAKLDHPDLSVLILSMFPEEQFAMRALKAGAAGYLNKQSAPEQLITAVRLVANGGTYISAALAGALARNLSAKPLDTINEVLSDREFTVLRGIANGHTVSQIAQTLNLSAKTVSTYRTRLLTKLGVRSNVELARYAAEHSLVK
ncbi:MAG: response regulator transcription factor [Methylibium sp.]|uniref:response regulator n=1 Tax=Methylibium sp. TaxID=2067992 RepID=UPI0017ED3169|nr:response regulator transcription factor [Methylibium sp.]MBA3596309.1 response regulator transcription factor [Methylibium sp.]